MREELSELLIMKHSDDLRNKLDLHLENPEKFDLSNLFDEILSDQNITSALNSYLDSFNLTDLFNDLTSLLRVKKIKDNLEIYLNFGLVETNNTFFPITFIPVDVQDTYSNKKRVLKICFEKTFVNKHALEYCFQAMHNDRNVASISSSVERVVNIEENETILSTIRDLLAKVCPLFNIDPHFFDSLEKSNKATSGILKMHNNMNLNVFDKGDESAINDYEELLDFLEDDEGIAEEFTEIVDNFIKEDPKNINTDVDSYWKEKDVSERLVHPSPIPVNEEQRKILIASKSKEGKYISVQGPPGTGKSHTISAILFDAIVDGRSVLMLSDKKEALDVVEDKLTEVLNTVRPDKNFQNQILRIGKSGNTLTQKFYQHNQQNKLKPPMKLLTKSLKKEKIISKMK